MNSTKPDTSMTMQIGDAVFKLDPLTRLTLSDVGVMECADTPDVMVREGCSTSPLEIELQHSPSEIIEYLRMPLIEWKWSRNRIPHMEIAEEPASGMALKSFAERSKGSMCEWRWYAKNTTRAFSLMGTAALKVGKLAHALLETAAKMDGMVGFDRSDLTLVDRRAWSRMTLPSLNTSVLKELRRTEKRLSKRNLRLAEKAIRARGQF